MMRGILLIEKRLQFITTNKTNRINVVNVITIVRRSNPFFWVIKVDRIKNV